MKRILIQLTFAFISSIMFTVLVALLVGSNSSLANLTTYWGDRSGFVIILFFLIPIGNSIGIYIYHRLYLKIFTKLFLPILLGTILSSLGGYLTFWIMDIFSVEYLFLLLVSMTIFCLLGYSIGLKIMVRFKNKAN